MNRPHEGIATDAAHSMKNGKTQYRGIDLKTGEEIFYRDLGSQTVNIGEFLAVIEAVKYILENNYSPAVIYTDSQTAISWFNTRKTHSRNRNTALKKAELFLQVMAYKVDKLSIMLKVSRRTLQEYRNVGLISYIQFGGKILYRESDIEKLLTDNYRKAFKKL